MDTLAAIQEAKNRGYDLALVAQNTLPPVARFINYGQFKYRQKKLEAKKKKNKGAKSIKSIRLTFKMGAHDVSVRQKQAVKFLAKGHKIKVDLPLRGRENLHFDLAIDKLKNFRKTLGANIVLEQDAQRFSQTR